MVMNNSNCYHLTYVHFTDQRITYFLLNCVSTISIFTICIYIYIYVVAIIEHFYMLFSAFVLNSIQLL